MHKFFIRFTLPCLVFALVSCTKQQTVAAVNTGVQVGVDICQEAPQLIPAGTPVGAIVALLCPVVIGEAPTVTVFIDSVIWNAMKTAAAARKAQSGQTKALVQ